MSTPILDRERSVPVRKPASVAIKLVNGSAWVVGGLLGAAAAGPWFPGFRRWVEVLYADWFVARLDEGANRLTIILSAIAAYYAAVVIHELGHLVAGKLVGYQFRQIRIGPIVISRPFSISFVSGGVFTGHARTSPGSKGPSAPAEIALALGGPLANVLTAFALLGMPGQLPLFSGYLLMFSLALGLATMIPAEAAGGYTDGTRVSMHIGGDPRGARRLALLRLGRDLVNGIAANRSDPDLFRAATAVKDPSSDTVMGHLLAFQRASLDRRWDEAGAYLETALEHSKYVGESMREAMKSEAATYQAKQRRRVDLAEQWLGEIPERPIRLWNRLRPEAAILEAKGDIAGAIAKLGAVERSMEALPPGGARDLSIAELREWRAELGAPVSA